MADKYLYRDPVTGKVTQREATSVGGNPAQAGDILALDGNGRIDPTVLPVGIGADTASLVAAETLQAGDFVYITSTSEVRKASAAVSGTEASGFVLAPSNIGESAIVYFEGRNEGVTGLTPGSRIYLSDTVAGGWTHTPISDSPGKKHQFLGMAISATSMTFEADDPIIL